MTPRKSALMWRLVIPVAIAILPADAAGRAERRPDAGRHPQGGELPDAAAGAGRRRARAALPERHAGQREPRQEVVPRRDRRRPRRDEDLLEAVRRAGRRVHRLQGEPRAAADDPQQHRHPDHLRRRRHEEADRSCPPARASRTRPGRPTARASPSSSTPTTRRTSGSTDVATNKPRQVTKTPVLATLVTNFEFTKDGKQIAAVARSPTAAPPMPQAPAVAARAVGQDRVDTDKNRLRTFPSLMTTPYEEQLLEWHATGQIALIDVATGAVKKVGAPAMIRAIDLAPDGKYVARDAHGEAVLLRRARSATSARSKRSGTTTARRSRSSASARSTSACRTTRSRRPIRTAAAGGRRRPRRRPDRQARVAWRADGQGLTYLEQEPGPANAGATNGRGGARTRRPRRRPTTRRRAQGARGGPRRRRRPPRKDRVYQWLPPFDAASAKVIYENPRA